MAKVTAPFLSINASGALAKTLVATTWKGIKVMRQFVVPANPKTAAQTAQRNRMSVSVNAWRVFFITALIRTAWDLMAGFQATPMSGFNWFTSNVVKNIVTDPDASYVTTVGFSAGEAVTFILVNVDDGAPGDETSNFTVLAGDRASDLSFLANSPITAGQFVITDTGQAGNTRFYSVQKDLFQRGGITTGLVVA